MPALAGFCRHFEFAWVELFQPVREPAGMTKPSSIWNPRDPSCNPTAATGSMSVDATMGDSVLRPGNFAASIPLTAEVTGECRRVPFGLVALSAPASTGIPALGDTH